MKKSELIRIIKEEIADVIKEAETVTTKQFASPRPRPKPIDIVRSAIESGLVDGETVKQKAEFLYLPDSLKQLERDFPEGWKKMKRMEIVRKILEKYSPIESENINKLTDKQINDSLNQLSVGGSIVPDFD